MVTRFALQQRVDRGAVGERAGEHQLRPHHRGEIGEAPGVDVEHRHHRHGGVGGGDVDHVGQRRRHRMQDGRTVAVEHALRIARGARGIAERGRGVLVEGGPFEILRRRFHQRLEAERAGQGGLRHVGLVGHDDEVLDRLELARQLFDQGDEGEVEHQHPVLAVVDDIDDLRREQARVDGCGRPPPSRRSRSRSRDGARCSRRACRPGRRVRRRGLEARWRAAWRGVRDRHSRSGGSAPRRCARPPRWPRGWSRRS